MCLQIQENEEDPSSMLRPLNRRSSTENQELEAIADVAIGVIHHETQFYKEIEDIRSDFCSKTDPATLKEIYLTFDKQRRGTISWEDFDQVRIEAGLKNGLTRIDWGFLIQRLKRPRLDELLDESDSDFHNRLDFADLFDVVFPLTFVFENIGEEQMGQNGVEKGLENSNHCSTSEWKGYSMFDSLTKISEDKSFMMQEAIEGMKFDSKRYKRNQIEIPKNHSNLPVSYSPAEKKGLVLYEEWEDIEKDARMQDSIQKNSKNLRNFTSDLSLRERSPSPVLTQKSINSKKLFTHNSKEAIHKYVVGMKTQDIVQPHGQTSELVFKGIEINFRSNSSKNSDAVNCIWQSDFQSISNKLSPQIESGSIGSLERVERKRTGSEKDYERRLGHDIKPYQRVKLADYYSIVDEMIFLKNRHHNPRAAFILSLLEF